VLKYGEKGPMPSPNNCAEGVSMKRVMFAGPDETSRGLIQYARRKTGAPLEMTFVCSAPETISYLNGHGPYADRRNYPLPELLILDLTNPHTDAWAVIDWLKIQPEFNGLHVCFIGRQEDEAAVSKARPHGPCFFAKPADIESYTELVSAVAALKTGVPVPHQ
jgi:two-component system response regulator